LLKQALVTGASGFIGSHLCGSLLQHGWSVRGLSRSGTAPDGVEAVACDLVDKAVPEEIVRGVDVVFHLAGKAHVLNSDYHDEAEYFPINIAATRKLLEAARGSGIRRFIYFSSVKAVGYSEDCMDESCDALPETMYGRSKLMAEQLVLHGGYVSEPVVIRPSMVYGLSDKGNLPKMIRAIRNGRFPPLPDTRNQRSMVHVGDIVHAALLAAEHPAAPGNVYIVTDGHAYSTRDIYEWICETLDQSIPAWCLPLPVLILLAQVGDMIGKVRGRRFIFDSGVLKRLTESECYSSEKIQHELGFKAQYQLKDVLPEMVHFLK